MDPDKWFNHAERLAGVGPGRPPVLDLRRGVSAAYYGLFHELTGRAATHVFPGANPAARSAVRRSYGHGTMKTVGQWCAGQKQPSAVQIRSVVSVCAQDPGIVQVAESVVALQQHRHEADYDHGARFAKADVLAAAAQARQAHHRLQAAEGTPPYQAFMALLTLVARDLR